MKRQIKIEGISFRVKIEKLQNMETEPRVVFQTGAFDGKKSLPINEFRQLVDGYVAVKTRNGHGLESPKNRRVDGEIYPA